MTDDLNQQAKWLLWCTLLPILLLSLLACFGDGLSFSVAWYLLSAYVCLLITFFSGIQWQVGLTSQQNWLLIPSCLSILFAWLILSMPQPHNVRLLFVMLLLLYSLLLDLRRSDASIDSYLHLRIEITSIALALLSIPLVMSGLLWTQRFSIS